VMVSSGYSNFGSLQTFKRNRIYQALGVEGVEGVVPLRVGRGNWITPATHQSFDVYVYGVPLSQPSLSFVELERDPMQLQALGNALFDRNSKKQYGDVIGALRRDGVYPLEVSGKALRIVNTFTMGATFAAEANLICSDSTFQYLFPRNNASDIQLGLIRLRPGASAAAVQAALQPLMRRDVKVLAKDQLAALEVNYWKRNSSVGFIFSLGVLVGFVVGAIIVYQILYGDVMNSLPQYATLKAMGYTDRFVILVVIQQSAILAFVGFIPGLIVSSGLYWLLAAVTKLSVIMTLERALLVLVLTFVMCVGSGSLATRKLVELDPADVF